MVLTLYLNIIPSNEDGDNLLLQRACLDYRRLEEAHLKYSIHKVKQNYPNYFKILALQSTVNETLQEIGPCTTRQKSV